MSSTYKNLSQQISAMLSHPRIATYACDSDEIESIIERYNANIVLSEAMLPTLHYFEICLRNRIDAVIREYYHDNWLFNLPPELKISKKAMVKIENAILRLKKEYISITI
jgi:hypothetical protein